MRRILIPLVLLVLAAMTGTRAMAQSSIGGGGASGSTTGNVSMSVGSRAILLNDPKYNLPVTGYTSCNVTTANGSPTITTDSADPPFTAAMVGWIIAINSESCQTYTNSGVNRFPTTSTTITGFTDAHHVTASSNANGVCTSACQMGWFPSDSQPAFQAAWNDALATGVCANVIIPAGYYAIGSGVTNTVSPAPCGLERVFGVQSNDQSAGAIGQGVFATRIVMLPSFDGTTCATEISAQVVCLFGSKQQVGPSFKNFTVDGLGFNNPTNISGRVLLQANYQADIENVQVLNWAGSQSANTTALVIIGAANAPATIRNFQCYAGGYNCINSTHQISVYGSASFNLGTGLNYGGDSGFSAGNSWYVQGVGSQCAMSVTGVATSTGDFINNTVGGNARAGICIAAASRLTLLGDTVNGGSLSGGTAGGINFTGGNATVNASGTKFTCTTAGCLFTSAGAGAVFNDMGGNTTNNTPTLTNITINNAGAEPSISGRCLLASAAGPLACGSSSNGKVAIPTTTATYTINTTAVQSGSIITITPTTDNTGIPSAPSCVLPTLTADPSISATSAGVSFTIAETSTTGITCYAWSVR